MPKYIAVAGTHGTEVADDWSSPTSSFARHLRTIGWEPYSMTQPFGWDTSLDGVWGKSLGWKYSGQNLFYYAVPPLCPEKRIPVDETYIIAFSHGVNVAIHALAMGLKAQGLISVCPPIRADMRGATQLARRNVKHWVNLHGDWRDLWAVFGAFGDGVFGLRREVEGVENILVPGGHGAAMRDENEWPNWSDWLEKIR